MEIADIFVVNKADREGADRTVASIESTLSLQAFGPRRVASADRQDRGDDGHGASRSCSRRSSGSGAHTLASQGSRRRARAEFRVRELLSQRFMQHVERRVLAAGEFDGMLDRIARARAGSRTRRSIRSSTRALGLARSGRLASWTLKQEV